MRRGCTPSVVEAHEAGKTNRAIVRWPALERIFCGVCAAGAGIGISANLGGRMTTVNGTLTVAVTIAIPAGTLKILADGRQKRK